MSGGRLPLWAIALLLALGLLYFWFCVPPQHL